MNTALNTQRIPMRTIYTGWVTRNTRYIDTTAVWQGTFSTDWHCPENWSNNKVPGPGDNVRFDKRALNDCCPRGECVCSSFTVTSDFEHIIDSSNSCFTIMDDYTNFFPF